MRLRSRANRPLADAPFDEQNGAASSASVIDLHAAAGDNHPKLGLGDTRVSPAVVAAFDPLDPFAAQLRSLRSLIFPAESIQPNHPQIITVISVTGDDSPGFAANLAVVVAQIGRRGLLVDANFAAPTHDQLFAAGPSSGTTGLLRGLDPADVATPPTAIANLDLLPLGPPVDNGAEFAERQELAARLRMLRRGHGFVIIDAGTCDASLATALSRGTAGAVLLVERDHTPIRAVRRMIDRLSSQSVNILGTVVTR